MMKKLIVLAIVALVFGMVSGAYADPQWYIQFKVTDQSGGNALATSYRMGVRTGASDGIDTLDVVNPAGTGAAVVFASWDLGEGSALMGYGSDYRPVGTQNLVWNLKIFLQPSCTATQIKISAFNPTGTYDLVAPPMEFKIPSLGLSYVFDGTLNGTSTSPLFDWTINDAGNYKGKDNALNAILAPVPEPGSILALASGLVGLVGFGIRRRK